MNILKLLPITVIALNFNHYSSFAENNSEFIENNSEFIENNSVFEETYSVVWDSKKNQADVKKTTNPIDDFVTELTEGSLIRQTYFDLLELSRNNRRPFIPNRTPPFWKKHNIKRFKQILETKIKEYFSSKGITYDEVALKIFIYRLPIPPEINPTEIKHLIITKIKNKTDPKLFQYFSKIFKTEK